MLPISRRGRRVGPGSHESLRAIGTGYKELLGLRVAMLCVVFYKGLLGLRVAMSCVVF